MTENERRGVRKITPGGSPTTAGLSPGAKTAEIAYGAWG